jgi:asparagine synthase (glutamine-hydrolysing)
MCGITGIASSSVLIKESVIAMKDALKHRGPDADGVFFNANETVALGHVRLSIIDLSAKANQPFFSRDGRYVAVFNGEIYNFHRLKKELRDRYDVSFKTNSDTEVIVEGFAVMGTGIVEKLQGMFAMSIYDQQEETLYLFRDRMGKKPLFYYSSETVFAFASELKSLLRYPSIRKHAKVNRKMITSFLHLGYIPDPETIYSSIHKFPAGQWGVLKKDLKLKTQPFWKIPTARETPVITSAEEAKVKLKLLLQHAVEDRLISDVQLGAFLSGGTDSSLVAALASKQMSIPLKTFSIGFRESKHNESPYASAVSRILNTDHTEYELEESEAIQILDTYVKHFDEPFSDTSAIPTMLVSKLAREEVKVVLTGDGGDELFLGYGAYTWANRLANPMWQAFAKPLRLLFHVSGQSRLQRIGELLAQVKYGSLRSHIFSQEHYFFSQQEIADDLLVDRNDFHPFLYHDQSESSAMAPAEQQALFDLQYYLKGDLLVKVDRASMYHALECRCPLLDHHVVEFAASVHPSLKMKDGKRKWILKELLREYLPDSLVDRPKWGFSVPLSSWLKGDLKYLPDKYLSREAVERAGLVKFAAVQKLTQDFFKGKDYLFNRMWTLIVLHKWLDENQ